MKQEQLEKEGIEVGDYYVVRRGKRIAVMNAGVPAETICGSYYAVEDPSLEVAFTEKQSEHLLGALERLNQKQKEQDGIVDKISELQDKISELENEISDLEEKQDEDIEEEFRGYTITSSGDGILFGCTQVSKANLKAISKLLKKGKK